MSFGRLLSEAKDEAEGERKETNLFEALPKSSLVHKAAVFLDELDDDDGFAELKDFEEQCLEDFAEDEGRSGDDYSLAYHDMHRKFCRIFEEKLEAFLVEHQCSADNFYRDVREAMELYGEADHAKSILRFITQASSFVIWADSMRTTSKIRSFGVECRKTIQGNNISSI
jgi:hypothetical protein